MTANAFAMIFRHPRQQSFERSRRRLRHMFQRDAHNPQLSVMKRAMRICALRCWRKAWPFKPTISRPAPVKRKR